ncbi:MAG: glycosyltransferase family 87 protein [Holosporales bacterium]
MIKMPTWACLKSGSFLSKKVFYFAAIPLMIMFIISFSMFLRGDNQSHEESIKQQLYGTDFLAFYSAGMLSKEGTPNKAYDKTEILPVQNVLTQFDRVEPLPFVHPPIFLILMQFIVDFSYAQAWFLFQSITLLASLYVLYCIHSDQKIVLATFTFFPTFANLAIGQTAFLTTALMGGVLINIQKNKYLAGFFLGLLTYKPQFGILIPLALIVGKEWKVFASASLTALLLILMVHFHYGSSSIWISFFNALEAQTQILHRDNAMFPLSAFLTMRGWGFSIGTAYTVHTMLQVLLVCFILYLWRDKGTIAYPIKAAGLVLAAMLFTPYLLAYDLFLLMIPLAYLAKFAADYGWQPYQKILMVVIWGVLWFEAPMRDSAVLTVGSAVLVALMMYVAYLARQSVLIAK